MLNVVEGKQNYNLKYQHTLQTVCLADISQNVTKIMTFWDQTRSIQWTIRTITINGAINLNHVLQCIVHWIPDKPALISIKSDREHQAGIQLVRGWILTLGLRLRRTNTENYLLWDMILLKKIKKFALNLVLWLSMCTNFNKNAKKKTIPWFLSYQQDPICQLVWEIYVRCYFVLVILSRVTSTEFLHDRPGVKPIVAKIMGVNPPHLYFYSRISIQHSQW